MDTLQNQMLIAMPGLEDPNFGRSVTYILEHNADGAMGIVVNHPLPLCVTDLLAQLTIEHDAKSDAAQAHVLAGGPVQSDRGFVLHTPKTGYQSSLQLSDDLMVTTSKDILERLTSTDAPDKFILALGYAGWSSGQLEQEIADNSWLIVPADNRIIFDLAHGEKWQGAVAKMGISLWQLSPQAGHA